MARRLRVMSYNVRRFKALDGGCMVSHVCQGLRQMRPHVVCLNEVDADLVPSVMEQVGAALGGERDGEASPKNVVFFGHARDGAYGNLVASRLPIRGRRRERLNGGTVLEYPLGSGNKHRIVRGLVVCDVDGSALGLPSFSVANTHLDHMDERERETQLQHIVEILADVDRPLLLCGDMNALHRPDYSSEEWARLEARHEAKGWSAPAHGCLDLLREHGFRDAFLGAEDSQEGKFTASVANPQYRIDYIFTCPGFRKSMRPARARVARELDRGDHFPVVVDFESHATPTSQL